MHGRILQAVSVTMVGQILSQAIRLGGNLIMTRLLVPEMFGLMSIVFMVQFTLSLLSDIGLRAAVIQNRRGDDAELLNTVWTIQVLRGVGLFVLCLVIAFGLFVAGRAGLFQAGTALGDPQLPFLLAVASLSLLISGFLSSNHMTAGRNLALRRIVLIELASQIVSLVVMVAVAYVTRSVWSIVISGIVASTATVALSHTILPGIRNHFLLNREIIGEIYKFGLAILVSSVTFVLATNMDRALLGALVSAATLGVYAIAQNLSAAAEGLISRLFESVVLPALSEASRTSEERLREQCKRLRLPFDLWYLGASGMLFALAPSIVSVLYDERYHEAGAMLQILSLSLIFSRFGVFSMAYVAAGKPEYMAIAHIVRLVAIAVSLPLLFHAYGIYGAIYAVALHQAALVPFYYVFNRRLGLNDLGYECRVLPAWPAGYALGMGLIGIGRFIFG
jgi:O-antigen/teichoic acid export membrane protein